MAVLAEDVGCLQRLVGVGRLEPVQQRHVSADEVDDVDDGPD